MATKNQDLASQVSQEKGNDVTNVVEAQVGSYKCPVGSEGRIPERAQSPSTVQPFAGLRKV